MLLASLLFVKSAKFKSLDNLYKYGVYAYTVDTG